MAEKSSAGAKAWATATLAGVVSGLIAAHLLPLSSVAVGAAGAVETAVQLVDRTHKGDRLNVSLSPALDAPASGRIALRHLMLRVRSLELREACEPPASPIVDPLLAKLPGRCLT